MRKPNRIPEHSVVKLWDGRLGVWEVSNEETVGRIYINHDEFIAEFDLNKNETVPITIEVPPWLLAFDYLTKHKQGE